MSEPAQEEQESSESSEFKDENLYESLKDYIESVVRIVDSASGLKEKEEPPELGKFDAEKGLNIRSARTIANNLREDWEIYPGFSECASAFDISDIYKKEVGYAINMGVIEDREQKDELIKTDTLPKFLTRYLSKKNEISFEEDVFDKTYKEFESYLTADSITYRGVAVLAGFEMSSELIELEDDLSIRSINESEKGRLRPFLYSQRVQSAGADYVIEKEYEVDKFGEDKIELAKETFENVLLALRLFPESGDVTYPGMLTKPISPFHVDQNRSRGQSLIRFFNSKYKLAEEQEEEFLEYWDKISGQLNEPTESYRIAIDKFSNSFTRSNENDRLLDSVIALEAMYLKSGEAQEMSYRLSQRGALLLGDSKKEAEDIKNTLKRSYNKRSSLVHGSSTNIGHDSIVSLHKLTRESLSTFLELNHEGRDHEDVLKRLDEEAITPIN